MSDFHRSLDRALAGEPRWAPSEIPASWQGNSFAVRTNPAYDDSWLAHVIPMRFIAGIDQGDIDPEFLKPGILWSEPVTMTIETRRLDPDLLELLFGQPVVPLCHQEIPCKGQE